VDKEALSLLEKNYIEDLKKNDLDKFERCKVLKSMMERNKWTPYTLAKKLKKPKTTVQDWLLYAKIDKVKYEKLKTSGFNDTDIFRSIRDNRNKEPEKIEFTKYVTESAKPVVIDEQPRHKIILSDLDNRLRDSIKDYSIYIMRGIVSKDTVDLLIELKTILNRIQSRAESIRR
jgi:hypothetical protein